MIELTNELKARFFAQYWGQRVFVLNDIKTAIVYPEAAANSNGYMELTPISLITDEDAIEVAKISQHNDRRVPDTHLVSVGKWFCDGRLRIRAYQYLQSKGYALPFMGVSVEELINAGWIKLSNS